MSLYLSYLDVIGSRAEELARLLASWSAVNSWSLNRAGLRQQVELLREAFAPLGGEAEVLELAPWRPEDFTGAPLALGPVLCVRRRPDAPVRALLVAHTDTVFPPESAFLDCRREGNILRGPGVADAKGGIAVLLAALWALEQSPWTHGVGWEVFLNPDEEIGSPGSAPLLREAARRCQVGLVFEPCLADGSLVGPRKGSGNFTVAVRGRAAHAGRNPQEGRNAIHALADLISAWRDLQEPETGTTVNVAWVEGGGEVNVVPDRALFRANVRVSDASGLARFEAGVARAAERICRDGIEVEVRGRFGRPPRQLDPGSLALYEYAMRCGREVGLELGWGTSGGASDGNLLATFGLPAVDGLGPKGGGFHTQDEHVLLPSLVERARLTARFLMGLGAGELPKEEG